MNTTEVIALSEGLNEKKAQSVHTLNDIRYKAQCFAEATQSAAFLMYEDKNRESLQDLDHAIDLWNELINMAPRGLKQAKLDYLIPATK